MSFPRAFSILSWILGGHLENLQSTDNGGKCWIIGDIFFPHLLSYLVCYLICVVSCFDEQSKILEKRHSESALVMAKQVNFS